MAMAKQANAFSGCYRELLLALSELSFQAYLAHTLFSEAQGAKQENLREWRRAGFPRPGIPRFGFGAALCGNDPFSLMDGGLRVYGACSRENEHVIASIKEVNGRAQAQVLAAAFEKMEGFLKKVGGRLYWQKRRDAGWHLPKEAQGKAGQPGTAPDFERRVASLCRRNCDVLFKALQKRLPGFADLLASKLNGGRTYLDIYRAAEFSRHAIVHAEGRFDQDRLRLLSPAARIIVRKLKGSSVVEGDVIILPANEQVHHLLTRLAEFAYGVYCLASETCCMRVDIRPQ